jgi:hypothetical protein
MLSSNQVFGFSWFWNNGLRDCRRGSIPLYHHATLALGSMHYSSCRRVKCIPPVQCATVIPDQDVTDLPLVMPSKLRLGRVCPQCIQQLL